MRVSQFDYYLPPDLIAQSPAVPRDSARLLVYDRHSDTISHRHVRDLPELLPAPATIIANNSMVRHCRLWGKTAAGKRVELFVLGKENEDYRCLLGGTGGQQNLGRILLFADKQLTCSTGLQADVLEAVAGPGMRTFFVRITGNADVESALERFAELPLPPYISSRISDDEQYQTVFAKELGSAAAPTAGLHFTPELIEKLKKRNISWNEVTLHVGLGTFLPLREDEIERNRLHTEQCYVSQETAVEANRELPVVAVGTTSVRTLESHAVAGNVIPGWQQTEIFLTPNYAFQAVDVLITNFHQPKSSLLLLVAAFLGNDPETKGVSKTPEQMLELLQKIYAEAIRERYRFFSFGDAMLLL